MTTGTRGKAPAADGLASVRITLLSPLQGIILPALCAGGGPKSRGPSGTSGRARHALAARSQKSEHRGPPRRPGSTRISSAARHPDVARRQTRRARRPRADHPLSDHAVLRRRSADAVPGRHHHQRALFGGARNTAAGGRRSGSVRRDGTRLYRGYLGSAVQADGPDLSRADAGAVLRPGGISLRVRPRGHGPVLLPGRRESVRRPQLLSGIARTLRRAR